MDSLYSHCDDHSLSLATVRRALPVCKHHTRKQKALKKLLDNAIIADNRA